MTSPLEQIKYAHSFNHFHVNRIKNAPNSLIASQQPNKPFALALDIVAGENDRRIGVVAGYRRNESLPDSWEHNWIKVEKRPVNSNTTLSLFEINTITRKVGPTTHHSTEISIVYSTFEQVFRVTYDYNGNCISKEEITNAEHVPYIVPEAIHVDEELNIPLEIDARLTINEFIFALNSNEDTIPTLKVHKKKISDWVIEKNN